MTTCAGVRGTICSTHFSEVHVPSSPLSRRRIPDSLSRVGRNDGHMPYHPQPSASPPFSREPQTTVGDTVRCVLYALTSVLPFPPVCPSSQDRRRRKEEGKRAELPLLCHFSLRAICPIAMRFLSLSSLPFPLPPSLFPSFVVAPSSSSSPPSPYVRYFARALVLKIGFSCRLCQAEPLPICLSTRHPPGPPCLDRAARYRRHRVDDILAPPPSAARTEPARSQHGR